MKSIRIPKEYDYNSKVELHSINLCISNGSNIGSSHIARPKSWCRLELIFIDKNKKEEK